MKRFLDFVATRPGVGVNTEESAAAVGYTRHQQAGMLGAFGRRVKGRYGQAHWFFDYRWSGDRSAWTYVMNDVVAKIVRERKR
jgi:hypothetical protein